MGELPPFGRIRASALSHPLPAADFSAIHRGMSAVIDLLARLLACPSVTPEDAGAQDILGEYLAALGFECHHLPFGDVPNLFARIGNTGPHIGYAGHTDVVPPGPLEQWTSPPFAPEIREGFIFGRGAADMKGSVAAFAVATAEYLKIHPLKGSISFLITGDEEGPAVDGTVKVLEWMKARGHVPDVALVGEPTNPEHLGQEIKIGRRGSLTGRLVVTGKQGHVAYPHLADNPLPRLVKLLDALASFTFDKGTEFFPATNLEVVSIDTANTVENIIPAQGRAVFNIRFNDTWSASTLSARVHEILQSTGQPYELLLSCGAESFMTQPGAWTEIVRDAVADVAGKIPAYTTNGGTSDARFLSQYCPVVECGAVNKSMHQIDEFAKISDLEDLVNIYVRVLERYFG
jgi:succinyl-diaminopimelate desuccinylase